MIIKLIWRNLWRNRRRTLITMASITFSVLFAIVMQSFQKGVFDNLIKNVVGYYSGYIQIHRAGYWEEQVLDNSFALNDTLVNQLNKNSSITGIVPRLETFLLASQGNTTKGCMLVGTDANKENQLTHLRNKISKGEYFNNQEEVVLIAEGLANRLNVDVQDTLVLFGQGFQGSMAAGKYPIKGLVHLASPAMNDAFVYLPLPAAQYFLSAENRLTSISLGIGSPDEMESVLKKLNTTVDKRYEVLSWPQMMPDIDHHIKLDGVSFYIFTGVLYLIIGFGFFGTILMMAAERKREFGMLIAIGMKKSWLGFILLGETLFITLSGVFIGIALSLPLVIRLQKNPIQVSGEFAKAYEKFGFEPIFPTALNAGIFLTQSLIVLCIAFIIGLYPIWYVRSLDAVKAMKN
ncbi:MAG TPA: ABC transporter permease [Haliscomenobacter sp.]|uniref:ABC transporter permease n=1 Tax=Haliscomenobacter sp. TaxID=2717303 RepID=UPI002CDF8F19|nr:FtsX-like permease family protein [Haliscomenobacter sp.]HOY18809.1 ABC transporter permease [Haliscomenobacter sp.]